MLNKTTILKRPRKINIWTQQETKLLTHAACNNVSIMHRYTQEPKARGNIDYVVTHIFIWGYKCKGIN